MVAAKKKLKVIYLEGLVNYESALKKQEELMQKRMKDEIPDTLLLLEHKSTYTIGLNAKEKYGSFLPALIIWLSRLIFWLYVINLGVGLFNLLPIGPLDGGRMFFVAALGMFKNEKIAKRIFMIITLIGLALIFINLLPFIIKLLKWIIQPFITLFF